MLQMVGSINVIVQVVGLVKLAIMRLDATTILVAPTVGALSRPVRTSDVSVMPALGGQSANMPKNVTSHILMSAICGDQSLLEVVVILMVLLRPPVRTPKQALVVDISIGS